MKRHRLSLSVQLSCLGLYVLGVFLALWQVADPWLSIAVLLCAVPLGLSVRLPYVWVRAWGSQALRWTVALAGAVWCFRRLPQAPADVVLVESAAVLGLALIVTDDPRENALAVLLSVLFAGYGGLSPTRLAFLPTLLLYVLLVMFFLYETRVLNLLGSGEHPAASSRERVHANWSYCLLHLFVFVCLFVVLVVVFPVPHGRSVGLMPSSFRTVQRQRIPLLWRQWLGGAKHATVDRDADRITDGSDSPSVASADAKLLVNDPKRDAYDAREGDGGAGMGRDLVFRVRSPAKLYWLVQLYDTYTGTAWRRSRTLRRGLSSIDAYEVKGASRLQQHFSIEKPSSARLPGAFRAERFVWLSTETGTGNGGGGKWEDGPRMEVDHVSGVRLAGELPPLPWRYLCMSVVTSTPTAPGAAMVASADDEAASHYLQLPHKVISRRTELLAQELVAGCRTPLEKALALRDHLRENYSYTLTPPRVPQDAEVVDFFLFESRAGFCQHFAQALTVLARAAGLPARLATGYSPGQYDLLSGCFEVYEYHAHAWSQILVPPYGWLTLDGVAPGELQLGTQPSLLSRLLDPFGEEWDSRPPELSVPTGALEPPPKTNRGAGASSSRLTAAIESIVRDVVRRAESGSPTDADYAKAVFSWMAKGLRSLWEKLKSMAVVWVRELGHRALLLWGRALAFYVQLNLAVQGLLLAVLVALLVLVRHHKRVWQAYVRWRARRRCEYLWERLQCRPVPSPAQAVVVCYRIARELLALGQYVRPSNMDLLEYVDWLAATDPELASDLNVVFSVFVKQHFGARISTESDATSTLESTARMRRRMLL